MMSHRILSAALLLCTLAAACGELPTSNNTHAQPAGPAYDSGYTIGSGNTAAEGGGFTVGSGNVGTQDGGYGIGSGNTASATTVPGDSTGRGGYGIGSGN